MDINQRGILRLYVGDFGIATCNDGSRKTQVQSFKTVDVEGLTLLYAAPEILNRHLNPELLKIRIQDPEMLFKSDVFSFAMTIYYMVSRQRPWAEIVNGRQIAQAVVSGQRPEILPGVLELYDQDSLLPLIQAMNMSWEHDWRRRPSITDLKQILSQE